jgi:hypothetical protein
MAALAFLIYVVLGLVNLVAAVDGISWWLDIHWVFGLIIAIIIGYIPIIGHIFGYLGASQVWGLAWFWAALVSFGAIVIPILLVVIAMIAGAMSGGRRNA